MKPAPFEYVAPTTLGEVVSALQEYDGEAKLLAGGQSLMPLLNMRMARPGLLVDLGRVEDLDYIRESDGCLAIGAMTTKRTVEKSALVASRQPLLHAATVLIGHPQIRNRGTVGGSLAQADPAAEYPAMAVVLDATLRAVGPNGERTLQAEDFFVTYLTTGLEPDEVLIEVSVPVHDPRSGWSFQEITRRHGDFAMAGAAVTLGLDGGGCCADPRIVLFGVGPTPVRLRAAEELVQGERPGDELFENAGRKVSEEIDEPLSDVHASAEYRRHLAGVLTRRTLAEAVDRAAAST
ncbi:MAG: xanthine dehydrogenase family protein subunit M [Deltaproteobacteria bacterium]|nr:xanthine dehydrogenase family protein subunit M [Deltaproteobacteria bacterium]MBW2418368.1 xanthine dehydrogenase family protein subunit M [Deltaproteobacteria bacterium]